MQNIVTSLLLGGERYDREVVHISDFTPFFESPKTHSRIQEFYGRFENFSCFNTHLLVDIHLPNSMWVTSAAVGEGGSGVSAEAKISPGCYVIYCVRNMKDTIVSFYHHMSSQKGDEIAEGTTFKSFLLEFVSGRLPYGCYLKHLQYHQELAVGCCGDGVTGGILLMRYEHMVADLLSCIKDIAAHLQVPLSDTEAQSLAERNSFKYMSEHSERFTPRSVEWKEGTDFKFIRKGLVGDHRQHFDAECDAIVDDYVNKYFGGEEGVPEWFTDFQRTQGR